MTGATFASAGPRVRNIESSPKEASTGRLLAMATLRTMGLAATCPSGCQTAGSCSAASFLGQEQRGSSIPLFRMITFSAPTNRNWRVEARNFGDCIPRRAK